MADTRSILAPSGGTAGFAPQSQKGAEHEGHKIAFPALRDPRYPVHRIADWLEPYLRVIVERFHPERIILFGSQAYGAPTEHSDIDLLVIRRSISSGKKSNMEIRQAFWEVPGPRPSFTILSKTPEKIQERLAVHSPFYEDIVGKGLTVYAAPQTDQDLFAAVLR